MPIRLTNPRRSRIPGVGTPTSSGSTVRLDRMRVRTTQFGRDRLRHLQSRSLAAAVADEDDTAVLTPAMEHQPAEPRVINPTALPSIRQQATWEPPLYTNGPIMTSIGNPGRIITLDQNADYGPGRFDQYPGPQFLGLPQVTFNSPAYITSTTTTTLYSNTWTRYLNSVNDSEFFQNLPNPYLATNPTAYWDAQWAGFEPTAEEVRANEAAEALRHQARVTAEMLLKRHLDEVQRIEWERDRRITVLSQKGNVYQIREGHARNIDLLVHGVPVKRYCIHPADFAVPDDDVVLIQKMLLESDEDRFLKIANVSPVRPGHGLVGADGNLITVGWRPLDGDYLNAGVLQAA